MSRFLTEAEILANACVVCGAAAGACCTADDGSVRGPHAVRIYAARPTVAAEES